MHVEVLDTGQKVYNNFTMESAFLCHNIYKVSQAINNMEGELLVAQGNGKGEGRADEKFSF